MTDETMEQVLADRERLREGDRQARAMLRDLTKQDGDPDYPDNLALADIIEKHLWRQMGAEIDAKCNSNARLREENAGLRALVMRLGRFNHPETVDDLLREYGTCPSDSESGGEG